MPDVDIDFPHHKQEEVMKRIFKKWPGRSARISNYVLYKDKSARREAAKRLGVKGNLPRARVGTDQTRRDSKTPSPNVRDPVPANHTTRQNQSAPILTVPSKQKRIHTNYTCCLRENKIQLK